MTETKWFRMKIDRNKESTMFLFLILTVLVSVGMWVVWDIFWPDAVWPVLTVIGAWAPFWTVALTWGREP